MKKNLLALFFISISATGFTQPATDFTADDCTGNTHYFFNELNSGKVIVLNWVMPCITCIPASISAYSIVQSFSISNPGTVLQYIIDDDGGQSCATLLNWTNSTGIEPDAVFQNSGGTEINEADYGGNGMPHIVVVGPDHTIYFNGLNGAANDSIGITNAINQALLATGINKNYPGHGFSTSMNPSSEILSVNYNSPSGNFSLEIINVLGHVVTRSDFKNPGGIQKIKMSASAFVNGIYFVQVKEGVSVRTLKFVVSK